MRVGPLKKDPHGRGGGGEGEGGGSGFDERIEDSGSGRLNLSCFERFEALGGGVKF